MGLFRRPVLFRTSAMAGLAIALALPFTRPASAAPGDIHDITAAPGFTLSVVHQFPAALDQAPKYLAASKTGNLYGAISAVGLTGGTIFRLTPGSAYTTVTTFNYARDGGPFGAPFLGKHGVLYGLTFDGGPTGIGSIYTVNRRGTIKTLLAFNGTNGMYPRRWCKPRTAPCMAPRTTADRTGTAMHTGSRRAGPVATFDGKDGMGPDELALGAHGTLYGTTESGGSTGGGVIFKLTLPH
jgi:uncharacterized repeat protein (TIGR03803 family)